MAAKESVPSQTRLDRKKLEKEPISTTRWIIETLVLVVAAFILAQGIKYFLVQPYLVPSGSMLPTIEINDRVLANKLVYLVGGKPARGEVVVLDDPTGQYPQLIKRAIATEGETVDFKDGAVYIDGKKIDEPYVYGKPTQPQSVPIPFTVPAGYIWVMGDNRTNSGDSRSFGPVPVKTVRGRGFWTYWPLEQFGPLK